MNRQELVETIAKQTSNTKAETDRFIDAFIGQISSAIKKDKDGVKLVGFGTFKSAKRKAREGRNPQTGEAIKIAARTVPVFRPGKELKDLVSKK